MKKGTTIFCGNLNRRYALIDTDVIAKSEVRDYAILTGDSVSLEKWNYC